MFSKDQKQLLNKTLGEISECLDRIDPSEKKDFSNEDLRVLYSLAYGLYQSGDYSEAKVIFHQLILSESLDQKYWLGFGACLQLEKKYDEALRAWGMASILDGDDPTPHFHAAECSFALNDLDQAGKALKASKELLKENHHELRSKIDQLENYSKKEKLVEGA